MWLNVSLILYFKVSLGSLHSINSFYFTHLRLALCSQSTISSMPTNWVRRMSDALLLFLLLLAIFASNVATQSTQKTDPKHFADDENMEHLRARHPEGIKAGALLANITALLQLERPALAEPDAQKVRAFRPML